MGEESIGAVEDRLLTANDVLVHFAFAGKPRSRPEPGLACGNRRMRMQLDHAIFPFYQRNLSTRLIKAVALANVLRQC